MEDYKKKYEEAINRATTLYDNSNGMILKKWLEQVFPELKESENERIRKEIHIYLDWLDGRKDYAPRNKYSIRDMITWLKKQSNRPQDKSALEAIKEEKVDNTNKVEPKFHEGDWVVYNNDICQIVKREEGCNKLVTIFGIEKELVNERNLSTARLWTIQDAKDGDVLKEESCIFIIEKMNPNGTAIVHCCLFNDGDFDLGSTLSFDVDSTYPATKEQRETLFKAMHEAGYEWNVEKKELKKIEQKPADWLQEFEDKLANATPKQLTEWKEKYFNEEPAEWSEEDERMYKILDSLIYSTPYCDSRKELSAWLKSLKDRVQLQTKPEWIEEDEKKLNAIYSCVNSYYDGLAKDALLIWLKSLKPQSHWKPSKQQMTELHAAFHKAYFNTEVLRDLYNDLTKL